MKMITLPMVLMVVGGLLTIIGGFLASYRANQEKLESSKKELEFQAQLAEKNKELAELSSYGIHMVTGGNSFPFLDTEFNIASPGIVDFMLVNGGKFPLYDVEVRVWDLIRMQELSAQNENGALDSSKFIKKIDVGNLRPASMGQTLYQVPKPMNGEIHHKIELLSRNSFVEQRFHIKFVDGKSEFLERSVEINQKKVDFKDLYKNIIQK